jgi:glycosyltransferase involved in cell wall biosynthesis
MRVAVTWPCNVTYNSFFIVGQLLVKSLIGHVEVTANPGDAALRIHVGTPEPEQAWMYNYRPEDLIFYTFAEASAIPQSWVEAFDRCREVWVPSRFTADVLAAAGVRAPLRVVPLGLDADAAAVPPPQAPESDVFTVMWQGVTCRTRLADGSVVDGDRKRGHLVESAFGRAQLPSARLILKSIPLGRLRFDWRTDSVWEICEVFSGSATRALDDTVDLFVWPTRGEAFGLLPLEKLARGIPCLVTNWSGVREYLDDFPGHALDCFALEDVSYNNERAQMANVDEDGLVAAIRDRYERRHEARASRAALAEKTIDLWNFRRTMLPLVRDAVEEISARA